MTYLEQLLAARAALLDAIIAGGGSVAYDSYSLDGESWNSTDWPGKLEALNRLILLEQNRVPGRRELRVVRGRRWGGYYGWR